MTLKDIVPYCLDYNKNPGNSWYDIKYRWIIRGLTYTIDSLQTYNPDHQYGAIFDHKIHYDVVNYINLSRYIHHSFINENKSFDSHDAKDNFLTLNLDNDITIFDKFIMVHKMKNETTESENTLFHKQHYFIANGLDFSAEFYNIGLYHADPLGGMATNLRSVFKDLIVPPVQPKPVELSLDEKLDDLVDEIMKDSRTMAIKKLKRMLNERL